jgi:uncharacterized protein
VDCPKCVGKLQELKVESESVDACFVCEGIWFDREELDKVIAADSKNFKSAGLDQDEVDAKEWSGAPGKELDHKGGKCPRCSAPLSITKYKKDVFVDVCAAGHGIWLDGGEIHKLRKRGMVDFAKRMKFAFSAEGWKTFTGNLFGRGRRAR